MLFSDLVATSDAAPSQYAKDGVVCIRQLFTPDEMGHIRRVFTDQVESSTELGHNDNVSSEDILAKYPRFIHPHRHPETEAGRTAHRYLIDQRLVKSAESLIGDVYGAQTMFYFKPPSARGQAMHQDNWFLKSHPETCLAAWVAVDDTDAANGGLILVPGSHKQEVLCHEDSYPSVSFSKNTVRIPEGMTRVQSELKAGDVLFFHGSMVHGSLPNSTTDRIQTFFDFPLHPEDQQRGCRVVHAAG
jgi:phytanoyl-CoA hydroxylase